MVFGQPFDTENGLVIQLKCPWEILVIVPGRYPSLDKRLGRTSSWLPPA